MQGRLIFFSHEVMGKFDFQNFSNLFQNHGLGLFLGLGLRGIGLFGLFFHNPVPELQEKGQKAVILELEVWPISKKLIGPLARFAHNLVGKNCTARPAMMEGIGIPKEFFTFYEFN
ncbi:hypothetical protein HOLleu_12290 [Holothuria leucospilota]|uniref:Uncharacterized protein n=1 Tax=Holothuria leucospilota TaxID=206669 RepID=A0A9Q1CB02_HOLLE|nr:hypothetical protein HOLleu_12290 [Holothuria leucospilota]